MLYLPTSGGLRYGHEGILLEAFLGGLGSTTYGPKAYFAPQGWIWTRICLGPPPTGIERKSSNALAYPSASPHRSNDASWHWNIHQLSIAYAGGPRLRTG